MITFLKLGGSLITDKAKQETPRIETIRRIASEISQYLKQHPKEKLILGHGAGSYGHIPAKRYATRNGVRTDEEWVGFYQVERAASKLNQIVDTIFGEYQIPRMVIPPFYEVTTDNHHICEWNTTLIEKALETGNVPLLYGDAVLDKTIGGTILSTEELFAHLATQWRQPARILLAGLEEGIWQDYPQCNQLIDVWDCSTQSATSSFLHGSSFPDVTGGMRSKVESMVSLIHSSAIREAIIFSGNKPGNVFRTLKGERCGTQLRGGLS